MGSACLFFDLNPKRAILSDINCDLVQTFVQIRDHPRAVHNRLQEIPHGKRSYYRVRKQRRFRDAPEQAARFVFLNRFCFNGIYRTNDSGEFNVPYAAAGTGDLPTFAELLECSHRLKSAEIQSSDFEAVLDRTGDGDFVYLDPPYALDNRRIFRQYGPQTFGLNDLQRLSNELKAIHKRGVRFLLSYAYCPEALAAFQNWQIIKIYTQRNVAGFSEHRRKAAEILVFNGPERMSKESKAGQK
jgi:DNA adenine methylase